MSSNVTVLRFTKFLSQWRFYNWNIPIMYIPSVLWSFDFSMLFVVARQQLESQQVHVIFWVIGGAHSNQKASHSKRLGEQALDLNGFWGSRLRHRPRLVRIRAKYWTAKLHRLIVIQNVLHNFIPSNKNRSPEKSPFTLNSRYACFLLFHQRPQKVAIFLQLSPPWSCTRIF